MIERRLLPHLDVLLVGALIALTGLGLLTIYSVFRATSGTQFWTQVYAVGLGIAALVVCLIYPYFWTKNRIRTWGRLPWRRGATIVVVKPIAAHTTTVVTIRPPTQTPTSSSQAALPPVTAAATALPPPIQATPETSLAALPSAVAEGAPMH